MVMNKDFVAASESEITMDEDMVVVQDPLVDAAKFKLDKYETELKAQHGEGKKPIRWVKRYTVGVTNKATDGIAETVNSFLGIVENVEDDAKRVLDGFKRDLETSLYAIVGNDQPGEHEEERTIEFVHHHAIMCIDVKLWRYNFLGNGGAPNSILCYIFCKSVLDRKSLSPTQLTYLLSEHAGDKNVEAYVDKLIAVWNNLDALPENVLSPPEPQLKALEAAEVVEVVET